MSITLSNENAVYTAGLAGAAVGASAAAFTKPYLKNGEATDTFVKEVVENLDDNTKATYATLAEQNTSPKMKALKKHLELITSAADERFLPENISSLKEEFIGKLKAEEFPKDMVDEVSTILKDVNKKEDLVKMAKEFSGNIDNVTGKNILSKFIKDGKIVSDEATKPLGEVIEKAAKSIKTKTIITWAAVGAAALAAATYTKNKFFS